VITLWQYQVIDAERIQLEPILHELGGAGWELVSAVTRHRIDDGGEFLTLFFKRPKLRGMLNPPPKK
jgi:hypothetical protein